METKDDLKALAEQVETVRAKCEKTSKKPADYSAEKPLFAINRAYLRLLAQEEARGEGGWQPIETAPDGTMVLMCSMKAEEARYWCFVDWIADGKLCVHPMWTATHWMPLPEPPHVPPDGADEDAAGGAEMR